MRTIPVLAKGGRKPRKQPERAMQVALFQWAALASLQDRRLKLLFAIPNGFAGQVRTRSDGSKYCLAKAKMVEEGLKPGVPDIFLPVAVDRWHGLWIELKAGDNKPSEAQNAWLESLRAQEYAVYVVWDDWDDARKLIETYLAGTL